MKINAKNLFIFIFCSMAVVKISAQPSPAELQMQQQQFNENILDAVKSDEIIRRNREAENAYAQQQAERNRLRREIAQLRRTPFYGAIAYDLALKKYSRGGGSTTKELAIKGVLKACGSETCQVLATFANTCAMVAKPDSGVKSFNDLFIGLDDNPQQAIVKSVRACEEKYGYDKCSYWPEGTKNQGALCSGYKYGIYNEQGR